MSNPFKKIIKNATETKKQWEGMREKSDIQIRKCPQCGAARPKNTDLAQCAYCGFTFMNIDDKIYTDTND